MASVPDSATALHEKADPAGNGRKVGSPVDTRILDDTTNPPTPEKRPPKPTSENFSQAALLLARAQAAFVERQLDRAEIFLAAALALGADATTILAWRARIAMARGDWTKADALYERLVSQRPDDAHALLMLARLNLKVGKLIWAMRRFHAASRRPKVAEPALLGLAKTLVQMGEFRDGLEQALAAAKIARTESGRRQALALAALCHYRLGALRPARKEVLAAGHTPLTTRLSGLLVERLTERQPRWHLQAALGLGTDSNPTMGPEPVPGWTGRDQAALDVFLQAQAAWNPILEAKHRLAVQSSVTRHFYTTPWNDVSNEQVASFDMTTLALSADYFRQRLIPSGLSSFRIGGGYELVELDGGKGIAPEPNAFLYSERFRFVLGWQRRWDTTSLDVQIHPSFTAYRDQDRTGPSLDFVTNASRFLLNQRLRLYGKITLGWTHARWKPWRWLELGFWTALSYLAPWHIDLVAWASYDFHAHLQSKSAAVLQNDLPWGLDPGQMRRDHLVTVAWGVGRRLDAHNHWRLDINVAYLTSRSTADFYEYSRMTALLAVTGIFGG